MTNTSLDTWEQDAEEDALRIAEDPKTYSVYNGEYLCTDRVVFVPDKTVMIHLWYNHLNGSQVFDAQGNFYGFDVAAKILMAKMSPQEAQTFVAECLQKYGAVATALVVHLASHGSNLQAFAPSPDARSAKKYIQEAELGHIEKFGIRCRYKQNGEAKRSFVYTVQGTMRCLLKTFGIANGRTSDVNVVLREELSEVLREHYPILRRSSKRLQRIVDAIVITEGR